jgi:hypothetical protein
MVWLVEVSNHYQYTFLLVENMMLENLQKMRTLPFGTYFSLSQISQCKAFSVNVVFPLPEKELLFQQIYMTFPFSTYCQ